MSSDDSCCTPNTRHTSFMPSEAETHFTCLDLSRQTRPRVYVHMRACTVANVCVAGAERHSEVPLTQVVAVQIERQFYRSLTLLLSRSVLLRNGKIYQAALRHSGGTNGKNPVISRHWKKFKCSIRIPAYCTLTITRLPLLKNLL